jgi:hypothetical protein
VVAPGPHFVCASVLACDAHHLDLGGPLAAGVGPRPGAAPAEFGEQLVGGVLVEPVAVDAPRVRLRVGCGGGGGGG